MTKSRTKSRTKIRTQIRKPIRIGLSATGLLLASALVGPPALAGTKPVAGTDGTTTAYDGDGKVLLVEACAQAEGGEWDYSSCLRQLRENVVRALCKKPGAHKWSFQIGAEKSKLSQQTTCK